MPLGVTVVGAPATLILTASAATGRRSGTTRTRSPTPVVAAHAHSACSQYVLPNVARSRLRPENSTAMALALILGESEGRLLTAPNSASVEACVRGFSSDSCCAVAASALQSSAACGTGTPAGTYIEALAL